MSFSVVISCLFDFNKVDSLSKLLISIFESSWCVDKLEVVIVDNGGFMPEKNIFVSSILAVTFHSNKFNLFMNEKLTIVEELEIGLSNARNTGILNSQNDIIVFLDDDTFVSSDFFQKLSSAFQMTEGDCIGGSVVLNYKFALPRWYTPFFARFFAPIVPNSLSLKQPPFYIIGANMSFRKELFQNVGLFNTRLGRKGKILLSGEDTEMVLRVNPSKVFIEPQLKVFTNIEQERVTKSYFTRRIFWQGITDAIIASEVTMTGGYDDKELSIRKGLFYLAVKKLIRGRYFEFYCLLLRYCAFKIKIIQIKCTYAIRKLASTN